jgi:IS1 family transposase
LAASPLDDLLGNNGLLASSALISRSTPSASTKVAETCSRSPLKTTDKGATIGFRQHEKPIPGDPRGDQYIYVALASSTRAIIAYRTGKRDSATTDNFIQDLRSRVIGTPEISTDGYHPYKTVIRDAFGNRVAHGTITKTYSVTHLAVKEASRRYSPAAVIAVERDVVSGVPAEISTSYDGVSRHERLGQS